MSSISYIRRIGAHGQADRGPKKLANYVPAAILAEAGRRARWLQELGGLWPGLVGTLAPHSAPLSYQGGRLTILVDAPVWADHLRRQQRSLLDTLQNRPVFADLREIRIRVRPREGGSWAARRRRGDTPMLSSRSAAVIAAMADTVPDPALGAALRRLSTRAKPGPGRRR